MATTNQKTNKILGLFTMMNLMQIIKDEDIDTYYIDLFAGAGGTSTGVEKATINGKKKCVERAVSYYADFQYVNGGETVVEDTKGFRTTEYKIKRKLMLFIHGIKITEK